MSVNTDGRSLFPNPLFQRKGKLKKLVAKPRSCSSNNKVQDQGSQPALLITFQDKSLQISVMETNCFKEMNYKVQVTKNSGFIFKTNELSNYAQRQRDSRNLNIYCK